MKTAYVIRELTALFQSWESKHDDKIRISENGYRAGVRTLLVNAPDDAVAAIELPILAMETSQEAGFEYIHLFVTKQIDMHEHFPALMNCLAKTGALWLS